MPHLQTPRLKLIPFGLELVQAALQNRTQVARLLGCTVPDEWPSIDLGDVLPDVLESRTHHPEHTQWSALIIHRADSVLIGHIGFYGPPDPEGSVKIGYGIIPSYRGKGHATEALQAMIAWAFAQQGVGQILADCEDWNVGSVRVLEKAGLQTTSHKHGLMFWQIIRDSGNTVS